MKISIIILLFLSGCQCSGPCEYGWCSDMFDYEVNVHAITPSGIRVDTSGHDIDLNLIDELADQTEACLHKNFPDGTIDYEFRKNNYCFKAYLNYPPRETITLKIPEKYIVSSMDDKMQLLEDIAPEEGCRSKGLPYNGHACRWRAGIQDSCTIVTTPNLYMFKDPLTKIMSGCGAVWLDPKLAECATPGVEL